ncbi:DJ-1/PfpI family protein [Nocardia brasiliensis]|uniref:DJ-1/PfpI family protein n=1 Tax=Nocardia brasiliensis TaxID=37326 RepID=UPI001884DA09
MQVAVVLYPGMTALDAIGPYELLRLVPGTEIRLVSNEVGPIITDSGVLALGATHTFDETPTPDVVVVPGSGTDTPTAMANKGLTEWLAAVHPHTKWTTSVCSGALILAAAGILPGHPATTHWFAQKPMALLGVRSRPTERIVRSGKILTAAGVSAGIDAALWLIGEIYGAERAEIVQLLIEYDPHPPYDSGHPTKASAKVMRKATAEMVRDSTNVRSTVAIGTLGWQQALTKIRGSRRR